MSPKKLLCVFSLPAVLCLTGICASAQANVTENAGAYIYVDAYSGSDGSSGAAGSPLQTIQAAVNQANSNNRKGVGTKIIVNPGVYRETVNIDDQGSTGATLTVEAAKPGTAIISGSDVLTGWNADGNGIYSHTWTADLGTCPIPSAWPTGFADIARRTEMVYIDGTPLTQVMAWSDLKPGTFLVNESANMMYVYPAPWVNMYTATVEAAVRPRTVNVSHRSDIVLRGLTFRHAASCLNTTGAVISSSNNVLVDSVQALWNNWGGIGIYSTNNLTVQNSIASHNGGVGISGYKDRYTLFSANESDYNNWRGAQAALFDWASGGTKLMLMRNTTVQNQFSYNNQGQGLWFDTDNKDITVQNATLSGNVMAGLQLEADEGPISLQNSNLCSNGVGVNLVNARNVSIQNNVLFNNSGTGVYDPGEIFVAGFANGHSITDWLTGEAYELFTTGTVISGNAIQDASAGEQLFGTYLTGNDWSQFANNVSAWSNTWYDPASTTRFSLVDGKHVDLSGWQAAVGSDYSSTWTSRSSSQPAACYAPAPDYNDFWIALNRLSYTMSGGQALAKIRLESFGYGAVHLSLTGLPYGVSGGFSANDIGSGPITLTLSAASNAASQTVPVTLWAVSGPRVHSVTFNVKVSSN